MPLTRRKDTKYWYIDVSTPTGRIRCSAGTEDKEKAKELEAKLVAESWRVFRLGEKPSYTWDDAIQRWMAEKEHKRSLERDKQALRWSLKYLRGMPLKHITKDVVDGMVLERAKEVSYSTVNREMAVIRAVLNAAHRDWEWLDRMPPKVRLLKAESCRYRWLTREEAKRLLQELPEHQADMAQFALATGLRQRNVLELEWPEVDLQERKVWIPADKAKTARDIRVPLNAEAVTVIRRQIGKHVTRVFTYKGQPVTKVNTQAWQKAVARAGVKPFRWHDLRHTWASWHVQSGTPLHVLKELGGWRSMDMVLRYAHQSVKDLAEYAEKITPDDTVSSQLVAV